MSIELPTCASPLTDPVLQPPEKLPFFKGKPKENDWFSRQSSGDTAGFFKQKTEGNPEENPEQQTPRPCATPTEVYTPEAGAAAGEFSSSGARCLWLWVGCCLWLWVGCCLWLWVGCCSWLWVGCCSWWRCYWFSLCFAASIRCCDLLPLSFGSPNLSCLSRLRCCCGCCCCCCCCGWSTSGWFHQSALSDTTAVCCLLCVTSDGNLLALSRGRALLFVTRVGPADAHMTPLTPPPSGIRRSIDTINSELFVLQQELLSGRHKHDGDSSGCSHSSTTLFNLMLCHCLS